MFDQVEKLKQDYTDKYVEVDANFPELARFAGHVGQVKTVNMNGRALVEFDAWSNIGWYDIGIDCLKVVPKPDPKAEARHAEPKGAAAAKPAAKPAAAPGEKKLSPLELARMQGAAKKPGEQAAPAAGGKQSTSDILAAARAGKAAGAAPVAEKSATVKSAAVAKPSTADILAAARAKKAAEGPSAPVAQAAASAPVVEQAPAEEPLAAKQVAPQASAPALPKGQRPSVSEILAWCRAHDAK